MLVFSGQPAWASSYGQIHGLATVMDARTLLLGGHALRLYGISVPDTQAMCTDGDGRPWACGMAARAALSYLVQRYRITCQVVGFGVDRVAWARCQRADGDLAELLVLQGYAVSNTDQDDSYVAAEAVARASNAGMWSQTNPTDVRALDPVRDSLSSSGAEHLPLAAPCIVKGVRRDGLLQAYAPDHTQYQNVHVDARFGDMWFCSLEDALFAGFPAAQPQ